MFFSVIIPAYNCEKTLEATVKSIQNAGLTEFEILLIDDGSSDGTAALCDRLCIDSDYIRCIHQKNAGVSAARNRGIEEARGEYIWFVDADDTVDEGAMAHAAALTAGQKPDMLIFGMSFDYYHRGRLYRREMLVPPFCGLLTPDMLKKSFLEFYDCNALTPVWNKLFRRSILAETGVRFCPDMHLMEDFLFVLDLLPQCQTICCLNEAIYRYRQGEDEKGAYRRLQRIPDLAEYILPFEDRLERLCIPDREKLTDGFYSMLLRQKMQYSDLKGIRKTLDVHKRGIRSGMALKLDPMRIYLSNRKTLLRHRIAVAVKSTSVYQKIKAVKQ